MGFKTFEENWKPKKLGKEERVDFLSEQIPSLVNFYIKKGHREQEKVEFLFEKMKDERFLKTLKKVMKLAKESESEVDLGLATVITDFLEKKGKDLDQDMVADYVEITDKILKKRIKKLNKKLGLDKDVIKELLVIVPDKEYITDGKYVGIYVSRMLRKLYILATKTDLGFEKPKQIKKLFMALFEEDLITNIAVNVLLERKDVMKQFNEKQLALWNLLTEFALSTIEDIGEKEAIKEVIGYYVSRRMKDAEKNHDAARRIQLSQVDEEEYPKIAKIVKKLSEKDKFKKYL